MFFNRVVSSGGRVWFRVVLVVLMCFFSSVFVDGLYPKDYPLQIASKIAIDNIYSKRSLTLWLKLHPSLWEIHQLLWTHSMFQKGMIYVPRTTLGKFTMISPTRATWKIPPRPFTTFVGNFGQVWGIFPGYVVWDHWYFSRSDFWRWFFGARELSSSHTTRNQTLATKQELMSILQSNPQHGQVPWLTSQRIFSATRSHVWHKVIIDGHWVLKNKLSTWS